MASAIGGFFRRIADFFDRVNDGKPRRSWLFGSYAGSRIEIDAVAFGFLFIGIVVAGIFIHGIGFAGWLLLFAAIHSVGAWLIFWSAHWSLRKRSALLALLLALSIGIVSERIAALCAFIVIFFLLLYYSATFSEKIRRHAISIAAVLLFSYVTYEGFSVILSQRRNAQLVLGGQIATVCAAGAANRITCRAASVEFDVPEFWRTGGVSRIADDLQAVAALKLYADSATDNVIAFAAFSSTPDRVMQDINTYFLAQKTFLQSSDKSTGPLKPQLIMKAADVQLYNLSYQSFSRPGYLGDTVDNNAIFLLHARRNVTWLFILDGNDFSGREFMLHRIMSGFR